jgi:two-component system, sensor histidine kinase and response regulator
MQHKLSILHLEDQEADAILIKSYINKGFSDFDYHFVDDEKDFIMALEEKKIDLILSDYQLPDYSGMEALYFVKNNHPTIPFIFVTGKMGEDAAIDSLLKGATDYVLKSKLERLVPAMNRVLHEAELLKNKIAADEALLKEQYLMQTLMNNIPDHLYFKDLESRFIRISKSNNPWFGLTDSAEAIGKTDFDFFTEEHARAAFLDEQEIIRTGLPLIKEERETWADRSDTWVLSTKMPLRDQDGNIIGTFGISREITERKRFEEELLKAKEKAEASDRLKTAFIRNISHEILTPLNGILGFGPVLTDPSLSAEQREEFLALVNKSSNRLIATVNNMMDVSLIVSGNKEINISALSPAKLLEEIRDKFTGSCQEKKLKLVIPEQFTSHELLIHSDHDILLNILSQLVDNAIKFTNQGTVTLGYEDKDRYLEFFVRDTGIGISEKTQQRMYEPFMQKEFDLNRSHEGSGLGLSVAKGLVELLGGRIWVESVKKVGSTFRFTIPDKSLRP